MIEAEGNGDVESPLLLREQLCFAIYSAAHALVRRYKPHLDRLGITYPQYLCMLVLWEGDGLSVNAIGARLQLDSGTLTPVLKRLEAAGLVCRTRDTADERQVRVTLTGAGRELRVLAEPIPGVLRCASGMAADDLAALKTAVLDLRDSLNRPTPE